MRTFDEMAGVAGGSARTARPCQPRSFGRDWPSFWRRLRTRRALLRLSDQALADVGLTRAQAEREARLPFWQL
ncbi:hypothetical protein A471_06721 [Ectopseudomonas mendocina DLHK]|nr:hypothetical protein A471_06721 [Pseudomonas mendocina DLHK]